MSSELQDRSLFPAPPSLRLPIERYMLLQELESGGMAHVYLARRSGPGGFRRLVAIKRIRPELAGDELLLRSFLEEGRIGALLRHPSLVPVEDVGEHDGLPFLVMEFVHGRNTAVVAQRGSACGQPLPLALGVTLVQQALEGLAHAHELNDENGRPLGLVHRDISPQNILIGFDGRVRLLDFGIAETAQQQEAQQRAGQPSGKAGYLSPEQCRGQATDARADLFGMGVLLHELMTQQRLFRRGSQADTLRAVAEEPIPAPRTLDPTLPEELERVALHALEREPACRYGSAREMADDLLAWLTGCGQPWGTVAMARYMVGLFGEELGQEREEHRRLLGLPETMGPPRPSPRPAAFAAGSSGPSETVGAAPALAGGAPRAGEAARTSPGSAETLPARSEAAPISGLCSLLVAMGLAGLLVLAAALAVLLVGRPG